MSTLDPVSQSDTPQPATFSEADRHNYAIKKAEIDRGVIGKFFGAPEFAPTNIAACVLLSIVVGLLIVIVWPGVTGGLEAAKMLVPVVTLGLGYIFGKK